MMWGQTHGDGGKGDSPRKSDTVKYTSNWEAIYNKPAQASKETDNKIKVKTA
tara:strand:- start:1441 stop:1596 length:156 start_codon:yes stop_codon:yes gene_type:complete